MEEIRKVEVPQEEVVKKRKDLGIILINVLLAIITIFLLGYIAYRNGYIDLDNILNIQNEDVTEENEEDENAVETEEEMVLSEYIGNTFTAVLPQDWTIIEYLDGDGTDMLVGEVTYTGLTGLKILHGEKTIFEMGAVSGIGFIGCPELPIFDDSSEAYLQEQIEMNDEVGMTMVTTDYTNTPYFDFSWFGKSFRRVNTLLYFDTVLNNNFFEPQCEGGLITVPGFSFMDGDGYEGTAYFYGINELATANELLLLDSILESMASI